MDRFSKVDIWRLRHRDSTYSDTPTSRMRFLRRKRRGSDSKEFVGKSAPPTAPWRIENILNGPPSASQWWEEESTDAEHEESSDSFVSGEQPISCEESDSSRKFQNVGEDAWEKARAAWRAPTCTCTPSRPPPVNRKHVIRGVTNGKRNYELPGRMTLSDMVGVYTSIWND